MSVAFIMINTVPDKMEAALKDIKQIKGVEEAYMLYGVYDIIAEVKAENVAELKNMILQMRKLQHILSTLTLVVVH